FRRRSRESCLRSKDSRAVWRGAVGKGPQGTSLAVYPTSCAVLRGWRHEVARVAVMTYLRRTSPDVLPAVPYQDMRPGEPDGRKLWGPWSLTARWWASRERTCTTASPGAGGSKGGMTGRTEVHGRYTS